jgi:hypothetical protein
MEEQEKQHDRGVQLEVSAAINAPDVGDLDAAEVAHQIVAQRVRTARFVHRRQR